MNSTDPLAPVARASGCRRWFALAIVMTAAFMDLVDVTMTPGLLMLLYPLTRGRELGWPLWGYVSMAGAFGVFGALVGYERRMAARDGSPLIELSLFRVRSFVAGIVIQTVFGIALGVFFLVWTLYADRSGLEAGARCGPV